MPRKKANAAATRSEARFRSCLKNAAIAHGFHYVEIPDAPRTRGTRFSVARQYDCGFVDLRGRYHGIEAKQVRNGYSWSFDDLSGEQENNLLDAERLGYGWLLVHHVARLSNKRVRQWKRENINRAWAIPIKVALHARDVLGFNSLEPEWMEEHGIRVFDGHRDEWYFQDWSYVADQDAIREAVGI